MTEVRRRSDFYQMKRSKTSFSLSMEGLADRKGWNPDRRASFTNRSELSDSLRRANNQESNRLQLKVQSYDKARELAMSEISQQERALVASARGRRSSSPGPAIRALIQEQISAEKQKWKEKFQTFMTSGIKDKDTPDDMNVMGTRLFGSSEHLGMVRYYDDDTRKSRSNSREEVDEDPKDTTDFKNNNNNKGPSGRKLAREQVWRNLSTPKHPKTSIKQLREKIEAEMKAESNLKTNTVQRVQTLPLIAPESRGLVASGDRGDRNSRSNRSMYLTVPTAIHVSKSDDNLAATAESMEAETQEVVKFDVDGKVTHESRNKLGIDFQRQRSKSLVVSSDRVSTNRAGTGNQIDLRLLLPPEIPGSRPRSGSESCGRMKLVVPEVKIQSSE